MFGEVDPIEGEKTMEFINRMASDPTSSDIGSPWEELCGPGARIWRGSADRRPAWGVNVLDRMRKFRRT